MGGWSAVVGTSERGGTQFSLPWFTRQPAAIGIQRVNAGVLQPFKHSKVFANSAFVQLLPLVCFCLQITTKNGEDWEICATLVGFL